jgi:acetyltransferase-like isoleucine patch superfamily enzyme
MLNIFKKKKKYQKYFLKDNIKKEISDGLAEVGDWTYGNPNIMRWDWKDKLIVGKYSSIGPGVEIIFGGNHRSDWITTSPLPAGTFQYFEKFTKAKDIKDFITSKGNIVIGNDVWIGAKVLILSGSTIGDGAVVAAGSVIAGNVEPYTIVCGNPFRAIKKRFNEDQIKKLLKIKWWDFDDNKVNAIAKTLCSENIDQFFKLLENKKNY